MEDTNTKRVVSFKNDVAPIFYLYKQQMMWRFDLTKYEDVKANYTEILSRIKDKAAPMPPINQGGPLSKSNIDTFIAWAPDFNP